MPSYEVATRIPIYYSSSITEMIVKNVMSNFRGAKRVGKDLKNYVIWRKLVALNPIHLQGIHSRDS